MLDREGAQTSATGARRALADPAEQLHSAATRYADALRFAAAHHLGAHGEPWTAHAFAFRTVCGAAFAAMFWFRSLAHAVYAHVLYDILVAAAS
jgi:hypothetical protein